MHFVWFSMWDGFFSPWVSESRPSRVATRVAFKDEWREIHLTWKTIQNAFSRILYTLRHFKSRPNQAKYNVQSCRSWKPCEMDLSHNCSLPWPMGECQKYICEKHQDLDKQPSVLEWTHFPFRRVCRSTYKQCFLVPLLKRGPCDQVVTSIYKKSNRGGKLLTWQVRILRQREEDQRKEVRKLLFFMTNGIRKIWKLW